MQKITRELIRQMASSEAVYYRGMRYYAAHAVMKVTWNSSAKQYRSVVKGSNQYLVTIQPEEEEFVYTCNCPAHVKYKGACKHVVATLFFIADYQQRREIEEQENPEDKTAYQIVEYFRKREYQQLTPQYYHLEFQVHIPEFLGKKNAKAYLTLYAGCTRMYKISSTKKFIEAYYNEETIRLGKEFCFIPGECAFDDESMPILEYMLEIYEIQETLGKTYYNNLFNRQELVLSRKMLVKLLQLAEGMTCSLNLYGKSITGVKIVAGNPEIDLKLALKKDVLVLTEDNEQKPVSLCEDGSILFYRDCLYLPAKDYICNILPFYSTLFAGENLSIEFRGKNESDFIEKVLPVIKKSMHVELPKELKQYYVVEPLMPQLYLDMLSSKNRRYISASVCFVYGEYRINPLQNFSAAPYVLVRDRKEEEELMRMLYDLNFKVKKDTFVLQKEEDIFLFLTKHIQSLQKKFEIFYSKAYKSNSLKKAGQISGQIRLDTEIDFLEINLEYSQIPKEELKDFFQSIRLKKQYYRLKSGAFIDLKNMDNQLQPLSWMLENGSIQGKNALRLPKSYALFLDEMLPKSNQFQKEASYQKLVEDMQSPQKTEWTLPKNVYAKLRPYQVTGYQWLQTLAHYGMGGILADDMGLGKTLQAIVYICAHPGTRTLVVCPTSLAYNWNEEFEKFAPSIRTEIVMGTPAERQEQIQKKADTDVLITTYPLIRKDTALYRNMEFDSMFIDEAQFIKNPGSLSAKAVKVIKAKHRFALTGTPIENALSELWSVFDFVMPGFFPKYSRFSEIYEKPILYGQDEQKMRELKQRIQPFVLRRMKKQVLKELPDKTETTLMAQMTRKQEKIYLSYLSRIQAEMQSETELADGSGRIQILAALTRLRQICCHPGTFVENYSGGSGKLDLLLEQLPDILEGRHSVIIFSQFTSMLSIIAKELETAGIPYYYLSGSTKAAIRKRYVREFNEGKRKVFLISLKAGGTGLNLTGADTVIHFDPWWNPAVEEQATDRAYRIGQEKKVHVIRYVMKDSIEEKIYQLQKRKKILSETVINSGEVFINQLTQEEILNLFS